MKTIRIGIIGLGANCRLRHVPGLQECENVEITGVVNRSTKSTAAVAKEFGIPKTYDHWEQLVADPELDAVVIGTWPYLHCPITLAALGSGKHVLTEARMACNLEEARQMLAASQQRPELVAQIVPSPLGFDALLTIRRMVDEGYLGELREVVAIATDDAFANPDTPLHWRQSAELSGQNVLALGILHEAVSRWIPKTESVLAQAQTFTQKRPDPASGELVAVERPDSVHVLTQIDGGALGLYHLSSATHFAAGIQVQFFGSEGTIKYLVSSENKLLAGKAGSPSMAEVKIPPEEAYAWRVERDFIEAIRGDKKIELTDFATGVRYMQFTEAVVQSAELGRRVDVG